MSNRYAKICLFVFLCYWIKKQSFEFRVLNAGNILDERSYSVLILLCIEKSFRN